MADTCSICLDSLHDGRQLTNFCNGQDEHGNGWSHIFHVQCIQGWINTPIHMGGITCPLCRRLIQVQDIEIIPIHLWKPMEIVLDGSHIIITGSIIRNLYISTQQWFQYQAIESLHLIALQTYVATYEQLEHARSTGANIGSLESARNLSSIQERVASQAANIQMNQLREYTQTLIGLLILMLLVTKLRSYQGQRGGGKVLSINGNSIQIPQEFECTIQEAFNSIKKGLVNTNGKKGARKTRRRR